MNIKKVCILGGTGFVGHQLSSRLSSAGVQCRIITRHPQRHRDMRVLPEVDIVTGKIQESADLERCFDGCEAVINLIGILNETGGNQEGFRQMHVELVERIVEAGHNTGIRRLLHMSALNASVGGGTSEYLLTKGEGENQAHTRGHASMKVTSFRPSVIFGPGDSFFNRFAGLLKIAPSIFPLACPDARFQPVYVADVAEAFASALDNPHTWGQRYDLCGPAVFTLREIVEYTAGLIGKKVRVVGLNDFLARTQARVMGVIPGKPFSLDNYLSLQVDSVCESNDLEKLGITAREVQSIVPLYLADSAQRNRYMSLRKVI